MIEKNKRKLRLKAVICHGSLNNDFTFWLALIQSRQKENPWLINIKSQISSFTEVWPPWKHEELYFGKFWQIHIIIIMLIPGSVRKGMISLTLAPSFPAVPSAPFSPMPPWENTQNTIYSFYCLFPTLAWKFHECRDFSFMFIAVSKPRTMLGTVHSL